MTIHVEIITPEKIVYEDDVDEIIAPTVNGHIGILPHHISLFTKIIPGELIIKKQGKEHIMAITGGFLEVANNNVNILAEYAIRSEHIEASKALEAQKRAEEKLKKAKEGASERDLVLAESELRRSILELKVAQKYRIK